MTRQNALAALVAAVMLAGVIGTGSLVSAEDEQGQVRRPARLGTDELEQGLRERIAGDLLLAQRKREEEPERPRPDREQAARRDREELMRRDRMRMEEEMRARRERGERPGPEPPFRPEHIEQFARMMEMVKHMQHTCFDPEAAAMIALAGLKDDVPRRPEEVAEDLEATLKRTRTLGLRNAIRLMLRDLYRHLGKPDRVLDHLREMLGENDAALQAGHKERPERPHDREEAERDDSGRPRQPHQP